MSSVRGTVEMADDQRGALARYSAPQRLETRAVRL